MVNVLEYFQNWHSVKEESMLEKVRGCLLFTQTADSRRFPLTPPLHHAQPGSVNTSPRAVGQHPCPLTKPL